MLDPKEAGAIWQRHFDTVTREEFVANVKRFDPDFAPATSGVIARLKRSAPSVAVQFAALRVSSTPWAAPSLDYSPDEVFGASIYLQDSAVIVRPWQAR